MSKCKKFLKRKNFPYYDFVQHEYDFITNVIVFKQVLESTEIPDDCTDIWLPNNIDLYEQRPLLYENLCLAEMVSNYKYVASKKMWKKRKRPIVIRYRHYEPNKEPEDFMREQVI